jgi:hypothetical protein
MRMRPSVFVEQLPGTITLRALPVTVRLIAHSAIAMAMDCTHVVPERALDAARRSGEALRAGAQ